MFGLMMNEFDLTDHVIFILSIDQTKMVKSGLLQTKLVAIYFSS